MGSYQKCQGTLLRGELHEGHPEISQKSPSFVATSLIWILNCVSR